MSLPIALPGADHATPVKPAADFPYYNGRPVVVNGGGWAVIISGVVLGFVALTMIPAARFPATLVPLGLFVAIQLGFLAMVTGRHWTAPFRRVGAWQVVQMLFFGLATVTLSFGVALVVMRFAAVTPNPLVVSLGPLSWLDLAIALLPTIPQLFGEELLAILPFLALLWLAHTRLGLPRGGSIAIALIGSSLLFGAAHLPTYGWNWVQSFGVIGMVRVVLTVSYIWTKNIWVSTGAHIVNDWTEIVLVHALSQAAP